MKANYLSSGTSSGASVRNPLLLLFSTRESLTRPGSFIFCIKLQVECWFLLPHSSSFRVFKFSSTGWFFKYIPSFQVDENKKTKCLIFRIQTLIVQHSFTVWKFEGHWKKIQHLIVTHISLIYSFLIFFLYAHSYSSLKILWSSHLNFKRTKRNEKITLLSNFKVTLKHLIFELWLYLLLNIRLMLNWSSFSFQMYLD